MPKKYSIKDVAKLSNVSAATVSRVINNNGRFSEETRKRVLASIKTLNYEQNKLAVSLRKKVSNTIGILVPDITNEFYSVIVKKCEQILFTSGFSTIVCNTERSISREQNYLKVLSEHMVDGIIIISANFDAKRDTHNRVPIVYIDRDPYLKNEFIVTSDHYTGAQKATDFFVENNYSPYIITTKTKSSATLERIRGFNSSVSKHFIDQDIKKREIVLPITSDKYLLENYLLDDFIKNIKKSTKKIGVFAVNDYIAFMVIRSALKNNVSIPDDLSVIGFDDAPVSLISTPSISTVQQDTSLIAKQSCEILINQLHSISPSIKKGTKIIPVKLILRESTP